ncbi:MULTISPECIES: alpha/beta hydrolase [Actinoalloteichus]|uniref:Alpha/beta hydrolase family n=1 Tax=Actinoalloteichus fjordicus TaxID=1612552 RepID=A0AAC9LH38_9PSEU|nr:MULTISPECIES: alpha/beta fold hydrolase [Actinoalloteichus]APU16270.1 Alpha/beta hydrolase family [Actinoalloteichus fjordicus]APU22330.1 Alpha/beta hydrolase family [Actinoalloteichus sp. GBA129-24]
MTGSTRFFAGTSPRVAVWRPTPDRPVRAVVLLLHGGRADSYRPARRTQLAYLRMIPFARVLHRVLRDRGVAVWLLGYRVRGWNAPDLDPVSDARWALAEIHARHPGARVVLVGHSMGGRVALRIADDPAVLGVGALAPWAEQGEPVAQLRGRQVLIAHGDRDQLTDPRQSFLLATRAVVVTDDVARFDVHGEGHAMARRAADWHRLVRDFVLGVLGLEPHRTGIANAYRAPAPIGLRVPL